MPKKQKTALPQLEISATHSPPSSPVKTRPPTRGFVAINETEVDSVGTFTNDDITSPEATLSVTELDAMDKFINSDISRLANETTRASIFADNELNDNPSSPNDTTFTGRHYYTDEDQSDSDEDELSSDEIRLDTDDDVDMELDDLDRDVLGLRARYSVVRRHSDSSSQGPRRLSSSPLPELKLVDRKAIHAAILAEANKSDEAPEEFLQRMMKEFPGAFAPNPDVTYASRGDEEEEDRRKLEEEKKKKQQEKEKAEKAEKEKGNGRRKSTGGSRPTSTRSKSTKPPVPTIPVALDEISDCSSYSAYYRTDAGSGNRETIHEHEFLDLLGGAETSEARFKYNALNEFVDDFITANGLESKTKHTLPKNASNKLVHAVKKRFPPFNILDRRRRFYMVENRLSARLKASREEARKKEQERLKKEIADLEKKKKRPIMVSSDSDEPLASKAEKRQRGNDGDAVIDKPSSTSSTGGPIGGPAAAVSDPTRVLGEVGGEPVDIDQMIIHITRRPQMVPEVLVFPMQIADPSKMMAYSFKTLEEDILAQDFTDPAYDSTKEKLVYYHANKPIVISNDRTLQTAILVAKAMRVQEPKWYLESTTPSTSDITSKTILTTEKKTEESKKPDDQKKSKEPEKPKTPEKTGKSSTTRPSYETDQLGAMILDSPPSEHSSDESMVYNELAEIMFYRRDIRNKTREWMKDQVKRDIEKAVAESLMESELDAELAAEKSKDKKLLEREAHRKREAQEKRYTEDAIRRKKLDELIKHGFKPILKPSAPTSPSRDRRDSREGSTPPFSRGRNHSRRSPPPKTSPIGQGRSHRTQKNPNPDNYCHNDKWILIDGQFHLKERLRHEQYLRDIEQKQKEIKARARAVMELKKGEAAAAKLSGLPIVPRKRSRETSPSGPEKKKQKADKKTKRRASSVPAATRSRSPKKSDDPKKPKDKKGRTIRGSSAPPKSKTSKQKSSRSRLEKLNNPTKSQRRSSRINKKKGGAAGGGGGGGGGGDSDDSKSTTTSNDHKSDEDYEPSDLDLDFEGADEPDNAYGDIRNTKIQLDTQGRATLEQKMSALYSKSGAETEQLHDFAVLWSSLICRMFKHDNTKTSLYLADGKTEDPEYKFTISSLDKTLYPHQVALIAWVLQKESSPWRGGVIADEMGFGKTAEAISVSAVSHRMLRYQKHIDQEDKDLTDKAMTIENANHVWELEDPSDDSSDQTADPTKPKKKTWSKNRELCRYVDKQLEGELFCFCGNHILKNHHISPRCIIDGIQVYFCPPHLVKNWIKEITELWPRMKIYDCSKDGKEFDIEDCKAVAARRQGWTSIGVVVPLSSRFHTAFGKKIFPSYYNGNPKCTTKTPITHPRHGGKAISQKTIDAGCFKGEMEIPIGRVFIDEAHQQKSKDNSYLQFLKWFDCPMWFMSGTPFDKGIGDLQYWYRAMEWDGWYDSKTKTTASDFVHANFAVHAKDANYVKTRLQTFHTNRDEQRRNNKPVDKMPKDLVDDINDVTDTFGHLLSATMIRRTDETKLFDHPCIVKPPHTNYTISLKFDGKVPEEDASLKYINGITQKSLADLNQDTANPSDFQVKNKLYRSLIVGSLPHLRHMKGGHKSDDVAKWVTENGSRVLDGDPYKRELPKLIKSSPKMKAIKELVGKISAKVNPDGSMTKGLIVAEHPVVAYSIHLMLQEDMGLGSIYVSKKTSGGSRVDITDKFKEPGNDDIQWIVSTYYIFGVGLNCQRATHVILAEMNFVKGWEFQAIKRISRCGQKFPTYSYRIILDTHPERTIYASQETREAMSTKVFDFKKTNVNLNEDDVKEAIRKSIEDPDNPSLAALIKKFKDRKVVTTIEDDDDDDNSGDSDIQFIGSRRKGPKPTSKGKSAKRKSMETVQLDLDDFESDEY